MNTLARDWRALSTDSLRRFLTWIDDYNEYSIMSHEQLVANIQKRIDEEAAPAGRSSTEASLWFQVDHPGWGDP
jgi:hypothetical protein